MLLLVFGVGDERFAGKWASRLAYSSKPMRVLIFHGYLLSGTGSNVYNASLAAALVRAGHEVHLFAQDRTPLELDWVDAVGDWDSGALRVTARHEPAHATVYRPDLGGLLPVYVPDRYDDIVARPFSELSEAELDTYLEANVESVREVSERVRPEVALANHLVMGPVILARALAGTRVGYAVKIHGSALEYVVKPHPRFLPHAREGLAGARGILTGSRHTAESLWKALDDPELPRRTRLGPPGVDVEAFVAREPEAARAGLRDLISRLEALGDDRVAGRSPSSFAREPAEAARVLAAIEPGSDRLVVFVGKLIGSKGVELLIAAWPLVLAAVPDARLVLVGFGALRSELERLARELAAGELGAARAIRAEDRRELEHLAAFLDQLDPTSREIYVQSARDMPGRLGWAGRLDHHELADLLPVAEALVVPSTFPEAFGMVAVEGASCGALPVVARHSGLAEVAEALGAAVPLVARPWLSFDLGPNAVQELAAALIGWLGAPEAVRKATRDAMVSITRERYSWEGVGRTVIAAARGELAGLPDP